jgi:hypothetical protein
MRLRREPVQIGRPLKTIVVEPLELGGVLMPSPAIEATTLHWIEGLSQNDAPN